MALGRSALSPQRSGAGRERLVPSPVVGRRRIMVLYIGFTVTCGALYGVAGMGGSDSVVHALTSVSTGGFSSRADSFASFGGGPRVVATAAMLVAGLSFFVLWWLVRGRVRPLLRSVELHSYIAIVAVATLVVVLDTDGISVGDALFNGRLGGEHDGLRGRRLDRRAGRRARRAVGGGRDRLDDRIERWGTAGAAGAGAGALRQPRAAPPARPPRDRGGEGRRRRHRRADPGTG